MLSTKMIRKKIGIIFGLKTSFVIHMSFKKNGINDKVNDTYNR